MAFAVEVTPEEGLALVSVRGDVDIATAGELRARVTDALVAAPGVVIDLDGVGFLDSTGLGVLVAAHRLAEAEGRALAVSRPQRIVKNALRLAQIDAFVAVYDTLDAAVAAVRHRT